MLTKREQERWISTKFWCFCCCCVFIDEFELDKNAKRVQYPAPLTEQACSIKAKLKSVFNENHYST